MICEKCHGEGWIKAAGPANAPFLVVWPCFDCNGSGVASCCDAAGSALADAVIHGGGFAKVDGEGRVHHVPREDVVKPGFWMFETTGVLRPAVEAYMFNPKVELTEKQVGAIRAYCRQWMEGDWDDRDERIIQLRREVDRMVDRATIDSWMQKAMLAGIDPL
jgi:hypothetical protein